ncbi:MAG TPA: PilN domain-containing protein [Geobacteraceae bacterium]
MRLTINLATRVYVNTRQLNICIAAAIALLLLVMAAVCGNIAADLGAAKRLKDGIAVLEGKSRKGAAVPEKDYQALLARIRFANGVIEQKTFDWLMLFDRLEGVVPDGIAISSIEPSAKDGGLRLSGVAKGFGNLRNFVENLEGSKFFTDVYLVSQSELQVSPAEKGLSFNITCKAAYK